MNNDHILPLLIALPLGAAFLIVLVGRLRESLSDLLATLVTAILVVCSLQLLGSDPQVYHMGGWGPPLGINLVSDPLSTLLLIVISGVSLLVCIYSIIYMTGYTNKPKYYGLLMLMIAGMNGVVLTGDLFNMYVFLEIAAIASYALVAFGTEHEELEASFKYLVLGSIASSFILFGIALMYSATGTLNLADISNIISQRGGLNSVMTFATALFIGGFGVKAAMVPFHAWLPDAHPSAPAPISAMLSGLLIKALGAYALIRLFYNVIGINPTYSALFIVLGLVSMIVGGLLAAGQWDFKRLLAYSSVSQMGYIVLALGIATPLAIVGGLFHLLNHGIFKSLLFLCSGAVERNTGTRDMRQMGGLCHRMPVTATTCAVGSLSISGIPPFNGFWSKLIIIIAAVQAEDKFGSWAYVIAALTVLGSFITLVYYVKVQRYVLFGKLPERLQKLREVPAAMCLALVVLALLCVAVGICCPFVLEKLIYPARDIVINKAAYTDLVDLVLMR
jgi:multicomponent Na+:H+ antiporter subunit D